MRRGGRGIDRGAVLATLLLAGCAGVHHEVQDAPVRVGRPYAAGGRTWQPADDPRYDAIGEASWYGSQEQGRRTASGETFDKRRVSAAHPTLPMPSYVEVTRLDTGDRMIVRINDRGPFARDRIIDLSREAARALGIDRAGHALVRVRRIQPTRRQAERLRRGYAVPLPPTMATASPLGTGPVPRGPMPPVRPPYAPLSTRPPAAPTAATPLREIVVAMPADPDGADALASALAGEGARVEAADGGYRIVTGPYADEPARGAALARLHARGYQGATALDAPPSFQSANGPSYP